MNKGKCSFRQKVHIAIGVWLHRHVILLALGFLGLNAVDGYLTNYAHQLAMANGLLRSVEANPYMQAFVGTSTLNFKGAIGIVILGLLAWWKQWQANKLAKVLVVGCLVFVGVLVWNLVHLRMI